MDPSHDYRPSPEALLESVLRSEQAGSGRLKVFLGAAPGVGKTYTMLEAARTQAAKGVDLVVGVVETHGRAETEAMARGLNIVERRSVEYRGSILHEMDLDAILRLRPGLVLVDELAHTNAPGSRHLKRYLDVEELLDAGIDVYTTVNIQHIESLNDAVALITGIRVQETVPDRIMARAAEVELVDLPVDELLHRLHEGRVYLPEQAAQAIRNYFRPGNLTALRQLALRHVAERVDDQMQNYMQAHAIPGPWPATERLLVSIGPSPMSPRLVRATRRLAERRHAEWIAVYVETPRHYRLSDDDRNRVAGTLRLAEELGGRAVTMSGMHVADDLLRYARINNVTEIVVGKSHRSRIFELLHGSIVKDLLRKSGTIDIYVISGDEDEAPPPPSPPQGPRLHLNQYLWSTVAVGAAAGLAEALNPYLSLPSLSMIFLLAVLANAMIQGLRASIYASLLSVLVFNFFFVPPLFTLSITRSEDIVALVAYLIVAILTSNLTGRTKEQAEAAERRESRTAALLGLSSRIAAAVGLEQVLQAIVAEVAKNLNAHVVVLLPENGSLAARSSMPETELTETERAAAVWAFEHNRPAGFGTDTLPGERWHYLPLQNAREAIGILAIRFEEKTIIDPEQSRLLYALSSQAAVAVERARLLHEIEVAKLMGERERLQAILLSSISHDLRTPLASILGSATTMLEDTAHYDESARRELLTTIREEAERLNRFVANLLDTTRLEAGALQLHREWVELNDVLGSARSRVTGPLSRHRMVIDLEPGLPLLQLDFVLFEQLFINLFDNAAKYSPEGSPIRVAARREEMSVRIEVEDQGIGIPPADLERIFDKFYRVRRGDRQSAGSGLGLSICRGIVEEHGGTIRAVSPAPNGTGTMFIVSIPIEEPPATPIPEEEPENRA